MDLNSVSTSSSPSYQESPDHHDFFEIVERDPTGRYVRTAEILGDGATKTVYKAFDEVDGIEVAWNRIELSEDILKSGKKLEKLCAEAELLKSLKHENVIRLYREKHKHLDIKVIKKWATQILKGLDYLHSHNPPIAHRDLKCENIFVNGNSGEVTIGDLGLATVLEHATAHTFIGTPEFMAPEMYEDNYDQRVDIYSFGMCMLQMVTRKLPYSECKNQAQVFKKVISGIKPAAISKVTDPQVREFIDKCLAPVSERSSASDLLKDPFLAFGDSGIATCSPSLAESVCSSSSSPTSHHTCSSPPPVEQLKVAVTEMNTFKLAGTMKDKDSISMALWIADLGGEAKRIDFVFLLQNDTLLSVTEEMVNELEWSTGDAAFIAELMAELISQLAPDSKATVLCQNFTKPEDNLNLSNMPTEESVHEDQVFQDCVSPQNLVEYDPAQESEHKFLSSENSNSSQFENMSFDQDQTQQHDNKASDSEFKHEEVLRDRRKGAKKSHKEPAGKLLINCFKKLLFRCRS
ncbi:hypothetical protein Cgig2_001332 [Carnegiea gigantea]|uniref:non-specific serine/threonine protein kinase n=1 Tax=Carnegiea gigantea TaxID=171969 RepID=A0A9Q1KVQ2_9CARY|nr:hypothetical protein Cgig2_001332 [Carnegiea gigantea]